MYDEDDFMQKDEDDMFEQYRRETINQRNQATRREGEDEIFLQEQDFQAEHNILDRVGYANFSIQATNRELQADPVKRFLVFTNSIANQYLTQKTIKLTRFDVNEINKKAAQVRYP